MKKTIRTILIGCSFLIACTGVDMVFNTTMTITDAQARVGRPLTPVSVAGVARRTTRRVIRRTAIYAPVLPAGCTTVVIEGVTLQNCGGTYYQPYQNQYVVVEVE